MLSKYYNGQTKFFRLSGMREIVAKFPIVKPKVERLQLQYGVTAEDLKEFVGPRHFLQANNGVKAKQRADAIKRQRAEDRVKKTFAYAGIEVMTTTGMKTLTQHSANEIKA